MTHSEQRRAGIQVVARAADLLRALESNPDGLSLSEIAIFVGLPKSTAHRLVTALGGEGLVTAASLGKVRLGLGLVRLGAAPRGHRS